MTLQDTKRAFLYYTENIILLSDIYTCIQDSFKLKDSLMKVDLSLTSPPDETHSGMNKKNQEKPKVKRKNKTDSTLKVKN